MDDIVDRLEETEDNPDDESDELPAAVEYPVESFVVAIYQKERYVGQARTRRRSLKLRRATTTSSSASWRGSRTTTVSSGPTDLIF